MVQFKKCEFVCKKVTFLGHILENGTVSPSEEKTNAIRNFPQPSNVKQVQSFLGLIIARPLSDLTKNEVCFVFGAERVSSFNCLKEMLCKKTSAKSVQGIQRNRATYGCE